MRRFGPLSESTLWLNINIPWLVHGRDEWSEARAAAGAPRAERLAGPGRFPARYHPWNTQYCTRFRGKIGEVVAEAPWSPSLLPAATASAYAFWPAPAAPPSMT